MLVTSAFLRATFAAAILAIGAPTASQAKVLYTFEGTSTQGFVDAGIPAYAELTYLVKWAATFDDFVTVGGISSPSATFDSCSIDLVATTGFSVTKTCGSVVTLSHDTDHDGVGFLYEFPYYGKGGADPILFDSGVFAKVGTYFGSFIGNLSGSAKLTVKDLSVVTPPDDPAPVPLPAALPLLAVGLGALGLARRRRV